MRRKVANAWIMAVATRWIMAVAMAWITAATFIAPLEAAPRSYVIEPHTVRLGFTAYGLGFIGITGQFTRFHGTLTLDPADPATCAVNLTADSASLQMPSQSMTDSALGPSLLDAAAFPTFTLDGACTQASTLHATVLLHGTTRPVTMAVTRGRGTWQATADIDRNDYGMGALPMLAGRQVAITITAGLPGP